MAERHPRPELPFSGQAGRCRRCGKPVGRGRRSWCGQACVDAYLRERGMTYRQEGLEANAAQHGGVVMCERCGQTEEEVRARAQATLTAATPPHEPGEWSTADNHRWVVAIEAYHREGMQVDHRVRLADGGTHDPPNIQVLCGACHRAKTTLEAGRPARRARQNRKLAEYG